jgi:hypothetical protein
MKKQRPKLTQYIYLVNSLLTTQLNRNGRITEDDVKEAVNTTVKVYDMIEEAIGAETDDDDEQDDDKPAVDVFADFPWGSISHTYTELEKWYCKNVSRSKRSFGKAYHDAIRNGYLIKNEKSREYTHSNE